VAETLNFAAVDLGAESGRVMLARFTGTGSAALRVEEIHRFANVPVQVHATLHWDILRLWGDVTHGLSAAAQAAGGRLDGVGVDTWGVDFGLLGRDGALLGNPVPYRAPRTHGLMAEAFKRVPPAEIFAQTGIQLMPINSLYQLLALARQDSPALEHAARLLTIPDLLNYWLSGEQTNEFSNATTTQCYNPITGDWAWELLDRLCLPRRIFGPVVQPGTRLGPLRPALAAELGLPEVPVIAPATHDTGSAVAAAPLADGGSIYLSSGTWSLMGVELPRPVIDPRSLAYNFTNEGGVGGTFRLLKNIMGLWLIQECRRTWANQGQAYDYAQLTALANVAKPLTVLIDVADESFFAPGDMPARIQAACSASNQPVPRSAGEIIRCTLESLALEYRHVAERLDELAGRFHPVIHIIGGGAQNSLLNTFTANATGRRVLAGPVEATALGNVLVQAVAGGYLPSIAEGRGLIRGSFPVTTFEPESSPDWESAYQRYQSLKTLATR
jgi:rhamnulokinase